MNKDEIDGLVERLRNPYSLIDAPRKELEQAEMDMLQAADALTTLSAENEKLRAALREAPAALNAMAAQVEAEFRDHDKAAARHDAIVMAFKKKVRQALAGDDHGHR